MGLDPMAEDLVALCDRLEVAPQAIIGHSAGAALALRLTEMRPQRALLGINAALGLFPGAAATLFPLMARALATAPFAARAAAALWGRPSAVQRLLSGTGSPLDAEGQAQYLTLVQDPDHVAGALAMMAAWRLEGLLARLPQITTETLLIAADGDRAVPPQVSRDAAARLPAATVLPVPGYGHMPQEEAPDGLASLILPWLNARLQPGAA
jgi:magnesium chelatase accessory protein